MAGCFACRSRAHERIEHGSAWWRDQAHQVGHQVGGFDGGVGVRSGTIAVAQLVARHNEIARARVVASRDGEMDVMTVQIETRATNPALYEDTIVATLKMRGKVELMPPGALPNDGKVIEDLRKYD